MSELIQGHDAFLRDLRTTLLETVAGLLLAWVGACLLAIVLRLLPSLEAAVLPFAISAKSVPVVALAPLLVLWVGNGITGKIILAALISFFPILIGFLDGMKSVPYTLRQVGRAWSAERSRVIILIEIPHAIPSLMSTTKVAGPLAVVGAVVAEFSGSDHGLGHAILVGAYRADAPVLFAAVVLVSLVGTTLYGVLTLVERTVLRRLRIPHAP